MQKFQTIATKKNSTKKLKAYKNNPITSKLSNKKLIRNNQRAGSRQKEYCKKMTPVEEIKKHKNCQTSCDTRHSHP